MMKPNLCPEERKAIRREQIRQAVAKYRAKKSPDQLRYINSKYHSTWRGKHPEKVKEINKNKRIQRTMKKKCSKNLKPRRKKFLNTTIIVKGKTIDETQIQKVKKAARKTLFRC